MLNTKQATTNSWLGCNNFQKEGTIEANLQIIGHMM